jgi:mRNA export factor
LLQGQAIQMTMFAQNPLGGASSFVGASPASATNPMRDFEVTSPPDDSISSLSFSPATLPQNFLIAGSWDNNVGPIIDCVSN